MAKNSPIEVLPLPKTVMISLAQHIGAPAVAVVKKGDSVKAGQLIGKSAGFISANIHSSVSGIVRSVDNVINAMGVSVPSVTIDVEGDEWIEGIERGGEFRASCGLSKDEMIARVAEAGIVGLGGAAFPTNVKLLPPADKTAEYLLVNGTECEPYLTDDDVLMRERSREIVTAVDIVARALGVKKAYIGIENNKSEAIAAIKEAAEGFAGIEVVPLRVMYPQGGEKQLIEAILGREVPSGALPIEVGAIVQNVGTMYAIYEALMYNKPLFERVVTVAGRSVKQPRNLLVRVGTPMADLAAYCGGVPEDTVKIIDGGPLMGKAMANIDGVVNKATSGILFMNDMDTPRYAPGPCIRCSKCVSVCPMGLEPYLLNTLADYRRFEECRDNRTMDCIECGSCAYTCPAHIRLIDNIRLAKREVTKLLRKK